MSLLSKAGSVACRDAITSDDDEIILFLTPKQRYHRAATNWLKNQATKKTHGTSLSDELHVFTLAPILVKQKANSQDKISFTVQMKDVDYDWNEHGRVPTAFDRPLFPYGLMLLFDPFLTPVLPFESLSY